MDGTSTLIVVPPSFVLDFEPDPGPMAKNQIAATNGDDRDDAEDHPGS